MNTLFHSIFYIFFFIFASIIVTEDLAKNAEPMCKKWEQLEKLPFDIVNKQSHKVVVENFLFPKKNKRTTQRVLVFFYRHLLKKTQPQHSRTLDPSWVVNNFPSFHFPLLKNHTLKSKAPVLFFFSLVLWEKCAL